MINISFKCEKVRFNFNLKTNRLNSYYPIENLKYLIANNSCEKDFSWLFRLVWIYGNRPNRMDPIGFDNFVIVTCNQVKTDG